MIGWILFAEDDDIEEIEINLFDAVTKSKDLDFDEGGALYCLTDKLITSQKRYNATGR